MYIRRLQTHGYVRSTTRWQLFDAQPLEYRNNVLPPSVRIRVSIEAGTTIGWERYVGLDGMAVGIPRFGASAPIQDIYENLGLTASHLVDITLRLLQKGEK